MIIYITESNNALYPILAWWYDTVPAENVPGRNLGQGSV